MHLYALLRGELWEQERYMKELSAKYMPYKIGKEQRMVQLAVKPIQLVEFTFPEDQLEIVQRTLWDVNVPVESKKKKLMMAPIRKALSLMGADGNPVIPMPTYKPKGMKFPIGENCVAPTPIGIKKDNFQKNTQSKAEMQKLQEVTKDVLLRKVKKENL